MHNYTITISKQGNTVQVVSGIQATDATAAIEAVERQFRSHSVAQGTNGHTQTFLWTGMEFEARRVN